MVALLIQGGDVDFHLEWLWKHIKKTVLTHLSRRLYTKWPCVEPLNKIKNMKKKMYKPMLSAVAQLMRLEIISILKNGNKESVNIKYIKQNQICKARR